MRTNQRLINYNTGTQGNIPEYSALTHGEIAVRYNQNDPALFIRDNNDNIVTFIASGAISTAIENAQGDVTTLSGKVETLSSTTENFITEVREGYYTSAQTETRLGATSAASVNSAKTYTDEVSGNIETAINNLKDNVVTAVTVDGTDVVANNVAAITMPHEYGIISDGTNSTTASTTADTLTITKNNHITVTVSNDTVTIGDNLQNATTIADGLMSATDKEKLNTIAASAQTNVIESVKVDGTALTITDKAVDVDLSSYPTRAEYNSTDKKIYFKHTEGGNVLTAMTIDATAFIKDGMVDNVTIGINSATSEQCLIVTFNTDSGKEPIYIKIDDIFDADNYYTKTAADAQISAATAAASAASVNSAKTYTDEVSGNIATLVYTKADKTEVTALSGNVVTELDKKVDKQTGYSLIADSEITRLANMSNSIATSAASGYMSSEMVTKLNGIEANAQVNQKALAIVTGNTGTYTATAETDTFSIVSNKTDLVSTNVDGSVVTIDVKFSAATQDTAGLMTSADKTKLDGMADGTAIQAISALTYANSANIHTLSGKVVSDYATSGNVVAALNTKADKNTFEAVSGVVEDNKNDIAELSGSVFNNYFTLASATTALGTKAGLDEFKAVSGVVETNSGNIYTLSGEVVTNETNISELSASTQTIETKANSAIQGYKLGTVGTTGPNYTTQSGARATYTTGGTATLDLTNLVIDCGTF